MKPRANIQLFGILIDVVNAKAGKLEKQVRQGHIAEREIEYMSRQIDDLVDYCEDNRHNRGEVECTQWEIEDLGLEISKREVIARRGHHANAELREISEFRQKWEPIVNNTGDINRYAAEYKCASKQHDHMLAQIRMSNSRTK